ncbi:Stealth CR1 domain-containing protein [Halomonas sp. E19]
MKDNDPVDVVITWVDGDDPEWFELYRKYAPSMAKKKKRRCSGLKAWTT